AASVHPVGIDFEFYEFGIGVLQNDFVDVLIAKLLELLEVVVIIESHPMLASQLADLIERFGASEHVVEIAIWEELNIAAEIRVAKFSLVLQRPWQNAHIQRIDVAADDR